VSKRATPSHNLAVQFPGLAREWNRKKNGDLKPNNVTAGSNRKVWWKCRKEHDWEATIYSRTAGNGCPYCAGKKATHDNNLQYLHPELIKEWNQEKNEGLNPKVFLPKSNVKVWWNCEAGHVYRAVIAKRTDGRSCPICAGKIVVPETSLATLQPELAKQWNYERNSELTPNDFTPGSGKKTWWICNKGHEWQAVIASRTKGRGCPACAGQLVTTDNCLATLNPGLSKEWNYEKNADLTPNDFTPGSKKKVWWTCNKKHDWQATIQNRTGNNSGCPYCLGSKTSKLEIRILTELEAIFPNVLWRNRDYGVEIDVLIPDIKIAIEVDGYYWHRGNVSKDKIKNSSLAEKGFYVVRLREEGLKVLGKHDIQFSRTQRDIDIVKNLISTIDELSVVGVKVKHKIREYLINSQLVKKRRYRELISTLSVPQPGQSLKDSNPELLSEWHYEKNYPLTSEMFSSGSHVKIWWKCSKGHAWKANIYDRANGIGCPACAGQLVTTDNCLATLNPDLSEEWNHEKNADLTPHDFTPGSQKKVWWKCNKGHEWQAKIGSRTIGTGCKQCYLDGRKQ